MQYMYAKILYKVIKCFSPLPVGGPVVICLSPGGGRRWRRWSI